MLMKPMPTCEMCGCWDKQWELGRYDIVECCVAILCLGCARELRTTAKRLAPYLAYRNLQSRLRQIERQGCVEEIDAATIALIRRETEMAVLIAGLVKNHPKVAAPQVVSEKAAATAVQSQLAAAKDES